MSNYTQPDLSSGHKIYVDKKYVYERDMELSTDLTDYINDKDNQLEVDILEKANKQDLENDKELSANIFNKLSAEFILKSDIKYDKTSQELTISNVKVPLRDITINAEGVVEEVEDVKNTINDVIPAIADALQPKITGDDWIEIEESGYDASYVASYFKSGTSSNATQQAIDKIKQMNNNPGLHIRIKQSIIETINSGLSSINDIESALSKHGYTMSDFITKTEELSELSAKSQELASECSSWWDKCKNALDQVTPDLSTLKNTVDAITPDLSTLKNTVDAITPDLSTLSNAIDAITPDLSTLKNTVDAITPDLSTISSYSVSAYNMVVSALDKVTPDLSTISSYSVSAYNIALSALDKVTPDLSTLSNAIDAITPDLSTISSYSVSAYNIALSALDKVTPDLSTLSNAILNSINSDNSVDHIIKAENNDINIISYAVNDENGEEACIYYHNIELYGFSDGAVESVSCGVESLDNISTENVNLLDESLSFLVRDSSSGTPTLSYKNVSINIPIPINYDDDINDINNRLSHLNDDMNNINDYYNELYDQIHNISCDQEIYDRLDNLDSCIMDINDYYNELRNQIHNISCDQEIYDRLDNLDSCIMNMTSKFETQDLYVNTAIRFLDKNNGTHIDLTYEDIIKLLKLI